MLFLLRIFRRFPSLSVRSLMFMRRHRNGLRRRCGGLWLRCSFSIIGVGGVAVRTTNHFAGRKTKSHDDWKMVVLLMRDQKQREIYDIKEKLSFITMKGTKVKDAC